MTPQSTNSRAFSSAVALHLTFGDAKRRLRSLGEIVMSKNRRMTALEKLHAEDRRHDRLCGIIAK